jgi:hypothetical protein
MGTLASPAISRGFDPGRIHEGGHRASSVRGAVHGLFANGPNEWVLLSRSLTSDDRPALQTDTAHVDTV